MIEDLDGADRSSRRARTMSAASIALVLGAIVGYGAIASPIFRGPYATPDPNTVALDLLNKPRYTPAPLSVVNPAAPFISGAGCVVPGSVYSTTVFIGDRPVAFQRPISTSPTSWCAIFWADLGRQPWERILP